MEFRQDRLVSLGFLLKVLLGLRFCSETNRAQECHVDLSSNEKAECGIVIVWYHLGFKQHMPENVSPANITAAALVMQFCLSTIFSAGALWIRQQEKRVFRFYQDAPNIGRYAWILLLFALATIGLLVFSDQFSDFWRPLSGNVNFSFVRWTTALLWVFVLDIACSAVLVHLTGGSYRSPFAPVYFILPAMAFFLREPPRRVALYTVGISVLFVLGLAAAKRTPEEEVVPIGAYTFVSIACLMLSVIIGFLTRPR
jgi:hypothetical protein